MLAEGGAWVSHPRSLLGGQRVSTEVHDTTVHGDTVVGEEEMRNPDVSEPCRHSFLSAGPCLALDKSPCQRSEARQSLLCRIPQCPSWDVLRALLAFCSLPRVPDWSLGVHGGDEELLNKDSPQGKEPMFLSCLNTTLTYGLFWCNRLKSWLLIHLRTELLFSR